MKTDNQYEKYLKDLKSIGKNQQLNIKLQDYNCKIKRHKTLGFLCGYVILQDNKEIYENTLNLLDVHGGITYNGFEEINGEVKQVIGFDCAHSRDYVLYCNEVGYYRDFKYVRKELLKLIKQLKKAGIH